MTLTETDALNERYKKATGELTAQAGSTEPVYGNPVVGASTQSTGSTADALNDRYRAATGELAAQAGSAEPVYEKPVVGASVQSTGSTAATQGTNNTTGTNVPAGFTGSTTVYGNVGDTAQEIINKMNANSMQWFDADEQTRNALHTENEYLASLLGQYGVGNISYNSNTGAWTGAAADSYTPSALPSATNQSDAINNYYSAAQQASLAALKNAYDQNMITLDASAAKIPGIYQSSMNAAAAQSAISQKNFDEYAAAAGLNSGAGGQARLAQNAALQSNLNALETEKANALADVETQRLSIQTEYQNAIAEAIANNEMDRAYALYQEAVRVDESIVSTALNQASENYKAWTSRYQAAGDYQTQQNNDYEKLLTNAQTLAAFGDFSGYAELGYTAEQIAQMYAVWAAKNPTLAAALGGTATGSGSAGSGGGSGAGVTTERPYTMDRTNETDTGTGTPSTGTGSTDAREDYNTVVQDMADIAAEKGKERALEYLDAAYAEGFINYYSYLTLKAQYS